VLSWGFGAPYVTPSSTIGFESQPVLFVIVISLFALTAIAMSFALSFVIQSRRSEQDYWRKRSSQSLIDRAIRESIDDRKP
jgi:hypothetical protein